MKRNSWHYKLATLGNDNQNIWSGDFSICEYTWKVFFGGILFLFMLFLAGVVLGWLGFAIYQILGVLFGFAEAGPAAGILLGIIVGIAALVAIGWLKNKWQDKKRALLKKDNKTFVANAYKSYKEKICFRVEFDEDNE